MENPNENDLVCQVKVRCLRKADQRMHVFRTHKFGVNMSTKDMYRIIVETDQGKIGFPPLDDEDCFFMNRRSKVNYPIDDQTRLFGNEIYNFHGTLL